MLNMPIEQEIETEHKILKNYNKRQTICLVICAVIIFVMYFLTRAVMATIVFAAPFLAVVVYIGWKDEKGLKAEDLFIMKMQKKYYKNETRKYRTKNGYTRILNYAYRKLKNDDLANKKIARAIEKESKAKNKKSSRTKNKAIY